MLSDTHLGRKNHHQFWSDLTENLFNEIIDLCNYEDIDTVIHLGDFFHSRKSLNVLTINQGNEICQKFDNNKINLYLVKGNHDQFYKNLSKPHSLKYLDLFKYVNVIDTESIELDDFILVPWGCDIGQLPSDSNLMGHFEINGFIINSSGTEQKNAKFNKSDFNKFNKVYSGHFHTPSKDGNIEYIGSPFPMDFNDVDSIRGYYILEGDTKQFIEYTQAPKFKKIQTNQEITEEDIKSNIIQLTFVEDYGNIKNEELIQKVNNMKPQELHIEYRINVDGEEELMLDEEFDVSDNAEVMREYIDKKELPKHINKNVLKNIVKNLEENYE